MRSSPPASGGLERLRQSAMGVARGRPVRRGRPVGDAQREPNHGPRALAPRAGLARQRPPVLPVNDAMRDRESLTRSFAHFLRREERVEYPVANVLRDPGAVVLDTD